MINTINRLLDAIQRYLEKRVQMEADQRKRLDDARNDMLLTYAKLMDESCEREAEIHKTLQRL